MPTHRLPIEVDPREIARYDIPVKPKDFDKRLEGIVGRNRFGGLNVRAVFGQDPELKIIVKGEYRMKYRAATSSQMKETRIGDGISQVWEDRFDIGIPRWFLEVWIPPEEIGSADSWEKWRYKYIDKVRTDVIGPFPAFGDYWKWIRLEKPDGSYQSLGEQTLQIVSHGWKIMQEMKTQSVDDLIIADYKEAKRLEEEADNVLEPEFKDLAKDWTKLIQKDFTVDQNPKGVKHDNDGLISGTQ